MPDDAMPESVERARASDASPAMTLDRWRAVDAVLQGALACERAHRDRFVRDACVGDDALWREVESLLTEHDRMTDDFLEQPLANFRGETPMPTPDDARIVALAKALAGHYTIEREIARGGMATVYVARDVRHGRRVAIKVMRDEVAAAVGTERFLEEIRVTASLQHPNILPLFDSGKLEGVLWYAMPFVDGETLRSRLAREGRLPVGEAMRLARQVADALEHAHGRGIVHRDVKPENVLLQGGHALVADFGIALALEHAGSERLTQSGLTLGTPQYMAPEQAAGERALDERVDVYALGVLTYEMLAGESPFAASSRQAIVQRMLAESPAPLAAHRADVPHSVDIAVRRALAKRPNDRFSSAAAFATALISSSDQFGVPTPKSSGVDDAVASDSSSSTPTARRFVPARIVVYAVSAAIAVGVAAGLSIGRSSIFGIGSKSAPSPALWRPPANGAGKVRTEASSMSDGLSLVIVDRNGRVEQRIAANRPWTPRFSPDGRRLAYGAFGEGRETSDLWIADLDANTVQRLTNDEEDSNDPQWSPDGSALAFSVNAPDGKDVVIRNLTGDTSTRVIGSRPGTQFPSDWPRNRSALIVTDNGPRRYGILVQPVDGSPGRSFAAKGNPTSARVSPDGRWIAYTSREPGEGTEVYVTSYSSPGPRVLALQGGEGVDPVWRGDGRELYYWRGDALVAVTFDVGSRDAAPVLGAPSVLFRAPYHAAQNTMYDVAPDGQRFAIVQGR